MILAPSAVVRLILVAAALITVGLTVPAARADAKPLKRWHTANGYSCTKYSQLRRVRRHKHYRMWPGIGRRVHVVCRHRLPRHRRHRSTAWVLPRYVVMCESGGNARVVNYRNPLRPAGLYQIITPTWLGYGGGRFAATADRASVYAQGVIARRILRGQGPGAWECW